MVLPAIIGAGASLLGGLFGRSSQKKMAAQQIQLQKDFAQQGVQWKVEDAKKAGIHPLAALGAQTHSYQPIAINDPLPSAIANMGQDIGRAIDASRPERARAAAVAKTAQDLSLQRMGLENELLAAQIAKVKQAGHPPALPSDGAPRLIDGQGNAPVIGTGAYEVNPMQVTASSASAPHQEPAPVTDQGMTRTPAGYAPVMSEQAKERLEEDPIGMLQWNVRNRLLPITDESRFTPPYKAPPGKIWTFDYRTGEYVLQEASETPEDSYRWLD